MMTIEIFVRYRSYGYVATSPLMHSMKSRHCSGPRQAADDLASKCFGMGNYSLRCLKGKVYVASGSLFTFPN